MADADVSTMEQIAIGKLLIAQNAEDFVGGLRPSDFSTFPHELLWASAQVHAGTPSGQNAMLESLIGDHRLTPIGDVAIYLSRCTTMGAAAVGDFGWYAKRIRESAELRTARRMSDLIQNAVSTGDLAQIRNAFQEGSLGIAALDTDDEVGVRLRPAASFRMKGVKWLYEDRIPAGMMTLLAGREGIGKSTVSLDLAARLANGTLPGRYLDNPQNVILCATEDSWEHTIIPRLKAVGADLDRVFHIAVQSETGGFRPISAPDDIRAIEKAIGKIRPALLVIDPIMSIINGKIDTHVQQQVQQGLEPLIHLCERATMAALGLIHVNKSTTNDALNSVMGSKAFTSLPRSVLYCIVDPDEEGTYLFTHEKCNLGPKAPSLRYRLASVHFDLDPDEVEAGDRRQITTSRVVWDGEDERRAGDVLVELAAGKNLGDLRKGLREFIDGKPHVVAMSDIVAEFDDGIVTRANIDQTLKRMVKKFEVDRVGRGMYRSMRLAGKP